MGLSSAAMVRIPEFRQVMVRSATTMRKIVKLLWTMGALTASACYGQPLLDRLAAQDFEVGGLRFYGVTAFAGYSTSAFPLTQNGLGTASLPLPGAGTLGADVNYGATASVGWHYRHERTQISVMYSGTYAGNSTYSSLNAFSQRASMSLTRELTPRLSVTLSATGSDTTFAEFIFQPTTALTQASSSFDDLAASASAGQFSNSQVAAAMSGSSPALESPLSATLLGDRILSYSGQLTMQYRASQRLTFHFGSVSAGGRRQGATNADNQPYTAPRYFGLNGGASMGFSYLLSPRSTLGINASADCLINFGQKDLRQEDCVTSVSATLGRKMGEHWFLSVHGGGSENKAISQAYAVPDGIHVTGGGQIGFRTSRSTLSGAYNRSSFDEFGFAVGSVSTFSGTWLFHPTERQWTFFTTFAEQQMRNTYYLDLSGWQASSGAFRSIGNYLTLTTNYAYISNSGTYLGAPVRFGVHSVRVSMSWSPHPVGLMPQGPSSGGMGN